MARDIAIPRAAATLLLVRDDPFQVLMVKRHARATFASALVFPGGVVDESDMSQDWLAHLHGAKGLSAEERGARIAAIRETFEETAVLLCRDHAAKLSTTRPGAGFLERIQAQGLQLDLASLIPFAHWITPAVAAKRFDTRFFLARAPAGHEAVCDGGETVSLEWEEPSALVARAHAGEQAILFPTRANLQRLAESLTCAAALEAARCRPAFTVTPRIERRAEGAFVTIPEEAGYGKIEAAIPPAPDKVAV